MMAERQVGERLSEEALRIAHEWARLIPIGNTADGSTARKLTIAKGYLAQARQLAEAERENGRLREALAWIEEYASKMVDAHNGFVCVERKARAARRVEEDRG